MSECPFPHAAGRVDPPPPARCPFSATEAPAAPPAAAAADSAARCPYVGNSSVTESAAAAVMSSGEVDERQACSAKEPSQRLLECPMGYGSGRTAPLAPLSCTICRALYYDAAMAACGHHFCRFCIGPFRDCPLCGADCQPLTPSENVQETVDEYIAVHCTDHQLVGHALAAPLEMAADPASRAAARATFLLQLALRSFAGGNLAAAVNRLEASEHEVRVQQRAEGGAAEEQRSVQLGAICGSLGDCHRRLGSSEAAVLRYHESVGHLQGCSQPSDEVKHALSVSHNKLGDMRHWSGDVASALTCYQQALELRRELVGALTTTEPLESSAVARQMDLAVSLVKVADAQLALKNASQAEMLLAEARLLADTVAVVADPEDKSLMAKLKGVQSHLDV